MANATVDLWIEGDWGRETINWHEEIAFDLNLFMEDQTYADLVNEHVRRSLGFLNKELEEIGLAYGLGRPV